MISVQLKVDQKLNRVHATFTSYSCWSTK